MDRGWNADRESKGNRPCRTFRTLKKGRSIEEKLVGDFRLRALRVSKDKRALALGHPHTRRLTLLVKLIDPRTTKSRTVHTQNRFSIPKIYILRIRRFEGKIGSIFRKVISFFFTTMKHQVVSITNNRTRRVQSRTNFTSRCSSVYFDRCLYFIFTSERNFKNYWRLDTGVESWYTFLYTSRNFFLATAFLTFSVIKK